MSEPRQEILEDLQKVKYVGPTLSEQLVEELSVRDVSDLVEAADNGWLQRVEGIGPSREEDIGASAREVLADRSPRPTSDANGEAEGETAVKTVERGAAEAEPPPADETTESPERSEPPEPETDSRPRPRIERFLDRLRCPACGHDTFERGDESLACTACRREYDRRAGIADLAPPDLEMAGGLLQSIMESRLYSKIYEDLARPCFTSLVSDRSLDEEKELAVEYLDLGQDSVVLDIACGTGNFSRYIAENIAASAVTYDGGSLVVGLDASRPMLERARAYLRRDGLNDRVFLVRGDASRIPLGRATFNRLHCSSALHLMEDIDEVLRNFARVLEPKGICVISTFLARGHLGWRLTKRLAEIPTQFHWFEREELHERLERAGLEVEDDSISRQAITVKARRK